MTQFRSFFLMVSLLAATCVVPGRAQAADIALVLANRPYGGGAQSDVLSAAKVSRQLRAAGFRVVATENASASAMVRAVTEFRQTLANSEVERAVVVLAGSVVNDGRESWLLGRSKGGQDLSLTSVEQQGLSVSAVDRMLAAYPGQALMVVAQAWTNRSAPGPGLRVGLGPYRPAQGVTLLSGTGADVLPVMEQVLGPVGPSMAALSAQLPAGVLLDGYLPRHSRIGATENTELQASSDAAYWSAVRDIRTPDAYRAYLRRFPNGLFVAEARRLLQGAGASITPVEPLAPVVNPAQTAEAALGLSRADRLQVQRDLTVLGHDTRGIDGVFGRGTRRAIRAYQRTQGMATTGYLTRALLQRFAADAVIRRAEIEQADRDFWHQTGVSGQRDDLRRYLDRYPQGLFAQDARNDLQALADAADTRAAFDWQLTEEEDTVEGYRDFLQLHSDSRYADEARRRITALRDGRAGAEQVQQDQREETAIAGTSVARLLIETALARAGYDPGPLDGRFTDQTRRAIRAFQRSADLPETGHVGQRTMAGLTRASLQ